MTKGATPDNTLSVLDLPREEILAIAASHGAGNVRVFGSFARGQAGPGSDLDLLVDVGDETSSWFPAGLIADLAGLLGREVDVVEPAGVHWLIRDKVLGEAVPL